MWFALLTSLLFDSRNLFTDNEHELLVEYLATYNPQSGRDEKATYIRLAENVRPKRHILPTRCSFFSRKMGNGTGVKHIPGSSGASSTSLAETILISKLPNISSCIMSLSPRVLAQCALITTLGVP